MKYSYKIFLFLEITILFLSNTLFGQWAQITNFPSSGRAFPFCFTVAGKAYLGCGFNASYNVTADNYEYNPILNSWVTKTAPPFSLRMGTFSFSIGNYGYVGSGSTNGGANVLTDFWRYDPLTDTWLQMADFPGAGRIEAATFVINGNAYVISGISSAGNPTDCWEYNPITDTWNAKASPPVGFTHGYVIGFSFGNYGYCGIGGYNSVSNNDFWRFDPVTNSWLQLASLPLTPQTRTYTVGGIDLIAGKGFVGLGGFGGSPFNNDFWSYDFNTDTWQSTTSLYNFPYGLVDSRTFNIGGVTYIGTGQVTGGTENLIYKFNSTTGLATQNNINTLQVFPNPTMDYINIDIGNYNSINGCSYKIINSFGQVVLKSSLSQQSSYIDLSKLNKKGIYFIYITDLQNNTLGIKKIILQ